ncbi:hypothetical protein, variant 1 [Verruconis gallopava]|uniref:Uncharacterized protein n=1 Tax=Verruconis gallopava TaxID=253628 RepID=A0A0D2ADX7_9PEZI|nr:hypothetical protein, variant 1 [Verruconis gallopava]KIW04670.1 hypothetical protein, variant 1 [Verruconis gallopava]
MANYQYQQPHNYSYEEYERATDPGRAAPPSGPNFRWWIPEDGIRRDVIQADIQRYLGPDAMVKPGEGRDENRGRRGYWIAAYRTFTPEMIRDLKADSANFERSGERGTPKPDRFGSRSTHSPDFCVGAYQDSTIHRSRQYWGPTSNSGSQPEQIERPQPRISEPRTHAQGSSAAYQTSAALSSGYYAQQASYPATPAPGTSSQYTLERPPVTGGEAYQYAAPSDSIFGQPSNMPRQAEPRMYSATSEPYSNAPSNPQGYGPARYFGLKRPEYLGFY